MTLKSLPRYLEQASSELLVLTSIRVNWGALKKDRGSSIAKGSIHHIAVSCDPTDVSHTAKDISWLVVKHELWIQKSTLKHLPPPSHPFPTHHEDTVIGTVVCNFDTACNSDTATTAARSKVNDSCRGFPQSPADNRTTNTDSCSMIVASTKQYMVHEHRKKKC